MVKAELHSVMYGLIPENIEELCSSIASCRVLEALVSQATNREIGCSDNRQDNAKVVWGLIVMGVLVNRLHKI